jgi:hypothetical protein
MIALLLSPLARMSFPDMSITRITRFKIKNPGILFNSRPFVQFSINRRHGSHARADKRESNNRMAFARFLGSRGLDRAFAAFHGAAQLITGRAGEGGAGGGSGRGRGRHKPPDVLIIRDS